MLLKNSNSATSASKRRPSSVLDGIGTQDWQVKASAVLWVTLRKLITLQRQLVQISQIDNYKSTRRLLFNKINNIFKLVLVKEMIFWHKWSLNYPIYGNLVLNILNIATYPKLIFFLLSQ